MIRAYDRLCYTAAYGRYGTLRVLELLADRLPIRAVQAAAFRADRREAAARYDRGSDRVGILRRMAVDRYDVRSDATCIYWTALERRTTV